MLNMIRMNLYRFFTTKSVYAILAVTFCVVFFITKEEQREADPVEEAILQEYAQQDNQEDMAGINLVAVGMGHESGDEIYRQVLSSGLVAMMCGIFAAVYTGSERGKGFLKNLNNCAGGMTAVFLSKSVPALLFAALEMGSVFLAVGSSLPYDKTAELMGYTAVQLLLHTIFSMGIMAFAELVRNQTVVLIFALFTSMGVGAMCLNIAENALAGLGIPPSLLPGRFAVVMQIRTMEGAQPVMLAAACVIAAAYLAAGVLAVRKRDLY